MFVTKRLDQLDYSLSLDKINITNEGHVIITTNYTKTVFTMFKELEHLIEFPIIQVKDSANYHKHKTAIILSVLPFNVDEEVLKWDIHVESMVATTYLINLVSKYVYVHHIIDYYTLPCYCIH